MMHSTIGRAFFRHAHGHGRGGGWGWGPGFGWGGGWGAAWAGRQRRGDVKYLVLELLAEGPKHGYEIIGGIEQRRGVRPSAGSVYPTLQMLEDGGFVTSEQVGGKRVYTITPAGTELLANRATDNDADESDGEPDSTYRLKQAAVKLGAAVIGARGADDATHDKIRAVLEKARKEVYAILASDEA